jgi:hypothetical protein
MDKCATSIPGLKAVDGAHLAACYRYFDPD